MLLPAGFINFNLKGHVNFSNSKKTSSNIVWSQIQSLGLHNITGDVLEYISQGIFRLMLIPKYPMNKLVKKPIQ